MRAAIPWTGFTYEANMREASIKLVVYVGMYESSESKAYVQILALFSLRPIIQRML